MKMKKYISAALAFVMMISILGLTAVPAKASNMTCSESVLDFIKDYEGFRSDVYWNGGVAYIGYGTTVSSGDYPNGISREDADALMREALAVKEETLNKMIDKYGMKLTQNQFDALMSFTYNIGTGWMSSSSRIFRYLTDGVQNYTDIEIVDAIGVWCHMGGEIVNMLVDRRIREAKMFLYGDYDGSDPHQYRYIEYDAGDGDVENSMMFYEYGKPYGPLQEAARDGYTLTGWITESGATIDAYTTVSNNLSVTAVWTEGVVTIPPAAVYSDVSEDDWFYNYVVELSQIGIFSGYEDGTFKPDNNVKCGEALKLILLAVGFNSQNPTGTHWASGYLTLAESKGIADDTLISDLNALIDRQTVAEIAAKAIGLPPLEPEIVFADTQDGFVLALYRCGIITGSGSADNLMYHPDNGITRAELSTIIYKICHSGVLPY